VTLTDTQRTIETSPARYATALGVVASYLAAAVPIISLVSVALLVFGAFTAQRALLIGIPLAVWFARPLYRAAERETQWPRRGAVWLAFVLLLSLLLRWPPSLHLQSWGDPGMYMAMAGYFDDKGTLDVTDEVRERLVSPEAVARFDANNVYLNLYQPGISSEPENPGHYIFQFYHVDSAWMAIFAGVLGLGLASASQVFFGLLSILFAALSVERLTRDWRFGVATAALFALLPLHIFFSKFPISEMPTLALAFISIYALAHCTTSRLDAVQTRWLAVAAASFAALFLTRISGFVYLPVIYIGAVLCQVFIDDARTRRQWGLFWFSLIVFYFGSVLYGLEWSHPYSISIYHMHFGGRLLRRVPWILLAVAVLGAVPFLFLRRDAFRARARDSLARFWSVAERWLPLVLLLLVLAGAARASLLAFTDYYKGSVWYDLTWHMSHAGVDAVLRSALLVTAESIGPALVVLLPISLWKPGRSMPRVLLALMVVVMLGYTAVLQWFLPFQYYYSRYLLSEVVPFSMLLIALRCADGWNRASLRPWIAGAAIATGIYFAWFAWPLIGLREASGAETSLAQVANRLDERSVVLVDEDDVANSFRYVTPLRMWFGKHVYTVRDVSAIPVIVADLRRARLDDIWLLRASNEVPAPFVFAAKSRFEQTVMAQSALIPSERVTESADFVLSRLDDQAFNALALASANGLAIDDMVRGCCDGVMIGDIWTDAHASIRQLTLPKGEWHRLYIKMRGSRPHYEESGLVVRVNGTELQTEKLDGSTFVFTLGTMQGPAPFDIDIDVDTFVPRDLGINDDPRSLGIDIGSLRIE